MKKSLIALAVAGAFVAPAMAATSNVDVYGKVRVSVDFVDSDAGDNNGMHDRVSRIGFKGSEDLGGGLKAIWQAESGFKAAGSTSNVNMGRNTFIGLAGGFGTVVLGRHDTPYKMAGSADLFGDTIADSQDSSSGIIGNNGFDKRANTALAYISPTVSGFHAAAAIVTGETGTDFKTLTEAYSLALVYANGPIKASFAYEDNNKYSDASAWKLNGSYNMGDLTLGATYEKQSDVYGNDGEKAYLVSAAYGMGPVTLAAQYGKRKEADHDRWALGAIYSMSKRTNVALAYMKDDAAGFDTSGFTVQMNHDF